MKLKITNESVEGLEIRKKIYDVTDTSLHGFIVRVHPSGKKVFLVRYMLSSGIRGRYTIGNFDIISVAQAKYQAKKILGMVALDQNPKAKLTESNVITLKEFIEKDYLTWSQAHHQWSKGHIQRLYQIKEFLNLPLNQITPHIIEKWRANRLKENINPNTVNRDIAGIKSTLSKAVEWGFLKEHPLPKLRPLKVDRSPNIRYLTVNEESRLRQALDLREIRIAKERESANIWRQERGYELFQNLSQYPFVDHLKPLVLLSLNTGARQGELFRLQWNDIDFDKKSIALVMRGKRKSHTRHIPLNKEACEVLQAWRGIQPVANKLVFPSKSGERFDNIQTSWENLKKEAKIDNFRWHDMRHHFASRLVMNGVPLNTVRELLGHTSVEMTLRYAHLAPEQKEKAVATLDRDINVQELLY